MSKLFLIVLLTLPIHCLSQNLDEKSLRAVSLAEEGKLGESFGLFLEIKKTYEKKKDIAGVAGTLNNIGRIHCLMNNLPEARRNFYQSDSLYRILGDEKSRAEIKTNIGVTYELGVSPDWNKALTHYSEAYTIYHSIHDSLGMNRVLLNIGTVHGRKGESKKALDAYLKSFPYLDRHGDTNERTAVTLNIGRSLYEIGLPDSAMPYLYRAKALNKSLEYDTYIYKNMAEAYAKLNEPDSAIHYLDLYAIAKDKLQDEQTTRNIAELSEKYKAQVKEEEIKKLKAEKKRDLLWLSVIILALAGVVIILFLFFRNRKIRSDHQKKDLEHRILLAQMNPHFLFNCLSSMQRMYVEGNMEKANDLMSDFSRLIRQILEHTSKTRITLKNELDTIRGYMEIEQIRLDYKFGFQIIVDESIDTNNILIPSLITQPLVENAIWHGVTPLENVGEIQIRYHLSADQKQLVLTIEDNGVGFPAEIVDRKHKSKGLELVEKRLPSRESIQITARTGGGTIVTINIPAEYEN